MHRGEDLQIIFWWLQSSCYIYSFFFFFFWICSLKLNLLYSNSPKCLWVEQVTTFALLNVTEREFSLFDFFEKYTSWACLLGSGLKWIFHWMAQLLITCKSLFVSLCDLYLSETCVKRDMSPAKILQVYRMFCGKSLMYMSNKRGPRTEPCGTSDLINYQEEIWPLRTTPWLRSWR